MKSLEGGSLGGRGIEHGNERGTISMIYGNYVWEWVLVGILVGVWVW
jgi:hypothetical protein